MQNRLDALAHRLHSVVGRFWAFAGSHDGGQRRLPTNLGVTLLEDIAELDVPLQLLIGAAAALIFHRRGDRLWIALVKGILVSLVAIVILSPILWITS